MAVASVTIPIQTNANSLGNVRPQASQGRGHSAPLAGATTNLQDQIDGLAKRTASVVITANDIAQLVGDGSSISIDGTLVAY